VQMCLGCLYALLLRPEFPGPSHRQCAAGQHGEAIGGAERRRRIAGHLRCGVTALIVDHDHVNSPGVILPQQRSNGFTDTFGLVACGDHRRDPMANALPGRDLVIRVRRRARTRRARPEDRAKSQAPLTV